ncbi:MAG: hypothetical protein ACREQI_03550 [Candidatus Binataceae bacterium]
MASEERFSGGAPRRGASVAGWLRGEGEPPRWLARFQPILARLGCGDARIGAGMAAVLIATALVYCRSLGNEFFGDDLTEIARNPGLGNWPFIWKSLFHDFRWYVDPRHLPQSASYRPLKNVWNALVFHLFGLHPAGYHAAMLALYLVVVWLVFRVACLLSGARMTGLLTAALFALIPVHAETVAWATDNEVLICAAFEFAAFEFYLR